MKENFEDLFKKIICNTRNFKERQGSQEEEDKDKIFFSDLSFTDPSWNTEEDEGELNGLLDIIIPKEDEIIAAKAKCNFFVKHESPNKSFASFPDLHNIDISKIRSYDTVSKAKKDLAKLSHGKVVKKDFDSIYKKIEDLALNKFKQAKDTELESTYIK